VGRIQSKKLHAISICPECGAVAAAAAVFSAGDGDGREGEGGDCRQR
jgi:hypothetical protein